MNFTEEQKAFLEELEQLQQKHKIALMPTFIMRELKEDKEELSK